MFVMTAEQMRQLDRLTIEKYGVPGLDLMERAGEGVFQVIVERFGRAARKGGGSMGLERCPNPVAYDGFEPSGTACGENRGNAYLDLSAATGGITLNICSGNYAEVFNRVLEAVTFVERRRRRSAAAARRGCRVGRRRETRSPRPPTAETHPRFACDPPREGVARPTLLMG